VNDDERRERGMRVRRDILGDAHVDASIARTTELTEEFQDLITRYAWGEIWTRPGLPHQTRSLVTLGMLIALGLDDEFQMHVRASAAAGVSRAEVKELLLQSAIYCGVPAANHAFRLAERTFAAMDADETQLPR
jgi:4-carboxymuconolactone decarboxylase